MSEKENEPKEDLIAQLEEMQKQINDGRGSQTVHYIIDYLKSGDSESAKIVFMTDGDKLYQYPEAYEVLKKYFDFRGFGEK